MKLIAAAIAASLAAAPLLAVPHIAAAQDLKDYGSGDICKSQRRDAGNKDAVIGGILGAVAGSQLAGHGAKTEGSVIGGVAGAAIGHEVGRDSVKCLAYPRGITARRSNCQWVQETYGSRNHDFEVCRDPDGVWRPSGRA